MRTVFKYEVPLVDHVFLVSMPVGAEVLCFANQRNVPMMWALVDPSAPKAARPFRIVGTGHQIEETGLRFVGAAQFADGDLVFHLFEVVGSKEVV